MPRSAGKGDKLVDMVDTVVGKVVDHLENPSTPILAIARSNEAMGGRHYFDYRGKAPKDFDKVLQSPFDIHNFLVANDYTEAQMGGHQWNTAAEMLTFDPIFMSGRTLYKVYCLKTFVKQPILMDKKEHGANWGERYQSRRVDEKTYNIMVKRLEFAEEMTDATKYERTVYDGGERKRMAMEESG